MEKLIVLSLALALALTMTSLAFAAPEDGGVTTLRITISPRAGPTGTAITVAGTGAHPDNSVKVSFVVSGEDWGPPLTTTEVTPNADGTFEAIITLPEGTADGTYAVRASQTNPLTGNLVHYWWNSSVVGAAPAPMPVTGGEMPQSARGTAIVGLVLLLKKCDRERLPAYLHSSEETISFYQRRGFEVMGDGGVACARQHKKARR